MVIFIELCEVGLLIKLFCLNFEQDDIINEPESDEYRKNITQENIFEVILVEFPPVLYIIVRLNLLIKLSVVTQDWNKDSGYQNKQWYFDSLWGIWVFGRRDYRKKL